MAFAHSPRIVTDGLVLALDAGNVKSYPGSGTTWYDKSGNGNDGTLTNGPTFDSGNGGSIVFDGVDDNVQLGNASNIIETSQSSVTVNSWVKTNAVGNYKKILVTTPPNVQAVSGLYLSLGPSPYQVYFGVKTNNGNQSAIYQSYISTSQYTNICGTYDGSTIRLYLNASVAASQAQTGNIVNSGITRVSGYDNNNETLNGNIGIVQVYNRALTAQEVLQNYNATKGRFDL